MGRPMSPTPMTPTMFGSSPPYGQGWRLSANGITVSLLWRGSHPVAGTTEKSERAERAEGRDQRVVDPYRSGYSNGRAVPAVLAAGDAGGGTARERRSARARQAVGGADDRVPRQRGALRPDGRVLRTPRRVVVVRTQRG